MNVKNVLVGGFGFKESEEVFGNERTFEKGNTKLLTINDPLIHSREFELQGSFKLLIFASRHVSESGAKTFTTHSIGNWTVDTEFGGAPRTLSPTSAGALSLALRELQASVDRNQLDDFSVTFEGTHHGPLTAAPTIFLEIGSSSEEWNNLGAAEVVAETCMRMSEASLQTKTCAIGFGGPHYAPKFTTIVLKGELDIGHIAPKYVFPLNEDMLGQAFDSTIERPHLAVIDWKGVNSAARKELCDKLAAMSIEVIRR